MFSEIMATFTEVAKMKTRNSEKRALFSIKCSRGALSVNRRQNIENWGNTNEKEKVEVKLHAALVLDITVPSNLRT